MPITPELKFVPMRLVTEHEQNFQIHPEEQLVDLEASHKAFSQYRTVVLHEQRDGTYKLVAGHGITKAMRRRGVSEVRAEVYPPETPETIILGILAADNRLREKSRTDNDRLVSLLQKEAQAGVDLQALGSSQAELEAWLNQQKTSFEINQEALIAELPINARVTHVEDDGVRVGRSPEDYLAIFENTTLRQIVIVAQKDDYAWMMTRLMALRKALHVETHAAVVKALLEDYLSNHPVPLEEEEAHEDA